MCIRDRLKAFGVEVEARVMSAHRTPELAAQFADHAEKHGIEAVSYTHLDVYKRQV